MPAMRLTESPASIDAAHVSPANAATAVTPTSGQSLLLPTVIATSATARPNSTPATNAITPRNSYSPMMKPATKAATTAARQPKITRTER
jgi:hypothetical protein